MTDTESNYINDGWNAKFKIAEYLVPVLISYRKLVSSGKSFGIPNWVVNDGEDLSDSEKIERWLQYLDLMIESFNFELNGEVMDDQKLDEQDKGLYLFAKYYKHLWD